MTILHLRNGWRLCEDGELQWIVEQWRKPKWGPKVYCGTKAGLMEVLAYDITGLPPQTTS